MKKCLLLTAIVFLACVAPARSQSRTDASAEEYAVYSAVISNNFSGEKVTADTRSKIKVVIQDTTVGYDISNEAKQNDSDVTQRFSTLAEGVVKDYKAKNNEPVRLKDSFDLNFKYVLVDKEKIEKIFNGGGWWEEFYKKYPGSSGLIRVSRVGFSTTMNQALVYIEQSCGGLCGTGHYVLLEKKGDRWQEVKRSLVWIS